MRMGGGVSMSLSNILSRAPGFNVMFNTTGGAAPTSGVGISAGACLPNALCGGGSVDGVTGGRSLSVGVGTPGWSFGTSGMAWRDFGPAL
jgi:hypothetical protein